MPPQPNAEILNDFLVSFDASCVQKSWENTSKFKPKSSKFGVDSPEAFFRCLRKVSSLNLIAIYNAFVRSALFRAIQTRH